MRVPGCGSPSFPCGEGARLWISLFLLASTPVRQSGIGHLASVVPPNSAMQPMSLMRASLSARA